MPNGQPIDGPEGLRKVLISKKGDFVRCMIEKMLTYALGRGMEEYDRCTVREFANLSKRTITSSRAWWMQ